MVLTLLDRNVNYCPTSYHRQGLFLLATLGRHFNNRAVSSDRSQTVCATGLGTFGETFRFLCVRLKTLRTI
jgi:hypothetical protein